jgi:hypothetical protein
VVPRRRNGLPNVKTDWYVRRLAIEHRQIDYVPSCPGGPFAGHQGKVLRSLEIERMSRWNDDCTPGTRAWYLLDVTHSGRHRTKLDLPLRV